MADSLYEYLPKQYALTGGLLPEYASMYHQTLATAKQHLFFCLLIPSNTSLLVSGIARLDDAGHVTLDSQAQHLVCFAGGMLALAARLLAQEDDIETAARLVDACVWAYGSTPSGIMPETFHAIPYPDTPCVWNATLWHTAACSYALADFRGSDADLIAQQRLPPSFANIRDRRCMLRPEAIESVCIMYRITGDKVWQEKGWRIFEAMERATRTEVAHAGVEDVTRQQTVGQDRMERFWLAESLKYLVYCFVSRTLRVWMNGFLIRRRIRFGGRGEGKGGLGAGERLWKLGEIYGCWKPILDQAVLHRDGFVYYSS